MSTAFPLDFHYDFSPALVLRDSDFGHKLDLMRRAGLASGGSTVWLTGFFYGRWESTPEEIAAARARLESEGFRVEALSIPLGHGSQALDPSKPPETETGEGWQPRVDANGAPWPNTSCPRHGKVLADSRAAAEILHEIGFTRVFYDDDLRVGTWGSAVQGCFCEDCLAVFRKEYPAYDGFSRAAIAGGLSAGDVALTEAWETFQSDSILQFLEKTSPEGLIPCPMIMHNGDRRHGLDVRRITERFPDAYIRVGEGHFSDDSFLHPDGKVALTTSIHRHLWEMGSNRNAFSETTTYPIGALSPANMVEKIRLEIDCGLRHIFLMSGTCFLPDEYWETIAAALPELYDRAASTPLPDFTRPVPEPIWHL